MPEGPFGGPRPAAQGKITIQFQVPSGAKLHRNEVLAEMKGPIQDMHPSITDVSIDMDTVGGTDGEVVFLHNIEVFISAHQEIMGNTIENKPTFEEISTLIEEVKNNIRDHTGMNVRDEKILLYCS